MGRHVFQEKQAHVLGSQKSGVNTIWPIHPNSIKLDQYLPIIQPNLQQKQLFRGTDERRLQDV